MEPHDIEHYLAELGTELSSRGIKKPVYIYVPPKKYILALKIMAGRTKDLDDCAILLSQIRIKTRQQAEKLLEEYILPEARERNAEQIEYSLNELFKEQ